MAWRHSGGTAVALGGTVAAQPYSEGLWRHGGMAAIGVAAWRHYGGTKWRHGGIVAAHLGGIGGMAA